MKDGHCLYVPPSGGGSPNSLRSDYAEETSLGGDRCRDIVKLTGCSVHNTFDFEYISRMMKTENCKKVRKQNIHWLAQALERIRR
jgi:hypothetical protein